MYHYITSLFSPFSDLAAFKSDVMAIIAELEDHKQSLDLSRKPGKNRQNLERVNKELKNFYSVVGKKIYEYGNGNYYIWQPKWTRLSREYKKKFRMDDIFYYSDILERLTKVNKKFILFFRNFLNNKISKNEYATLGN